MNKTLFTEQLAIVSQSLYLINLLLIPGLAFLVLIWLFAGKKTDNAIRKWQRIHLYRAFQLTLGAGFFVFVIPLVVILLSQNIQASLMVMLVYMVTLHAVFVLIGMFNLSRAMAKKLPIF